jgi:hypothetical protein
VTAWVTAKLKRRARGLLAPDARQHGSRCRRITWSWKASLSENEERGRKDSEAMKRKGTMLAAAVTSVLRAYYAHRSG